MAEIGKIVGGAETVVLAALDAAPERSIPSSDFLALWTPDEVAATMAASPDLQYAALTAIAQGSVNLDSARLAGLLALAVAKGTLTSDRAAQIAAGTPLA